MAGVAARYGETDASPYLLPISVDGLIVVASICLVELAGRIRDAETALAPATVAAQTAAAGAPAEPRQQGPAPTPTATSSSTRPATGNGTVPMIGQLTR